MRHTDTRRIDQTSIGTSSTNALREVAGRIQKLTFREMQALAGCLATEEQLSQVGGVNALAIRILTAVDKLVAA